MLLQAPVVALFKSLPMLTDVAILCGFSFFVFGTVAVQLFAGVMQNRWVLASDVSAGVAVSSVFLQPAVSAVKGASHACTHQPTASYEMPLSMLHAGAVLLTWHLQAWMPATTAMSATR
jgi:hypothetical protein